MFGIPTPMTKVSYDTYRTRIKLGWCEDRARKAVPIPTRVGIGQAIPVDEFKYIIDLHRTLNVGHRHHYKAVCSCGKEMTLFNTELLFDVHCGCQCGGTSPTVLNWLKMLEEDEEYCKFAKEQKTIPTCAGWFRFRHF